jgi:hypothetical protein
LSLSYRKPRDATEVHSRHVRLQVRSRIKTIGKAEVKRLREGTARILESLKESCQQEKKIPVSRNICLFIGAFGRNPTIRVFSSCFLDMFGNGRLSNYTKLEFRKGELSPIRTVSIWIHYHWPPTLPQFARNCAEISLALIICAYRHHKWRDEPGIRAVSNRMELFSGGKTALRSSAAEPGRPESAGRNPADLHDPILIRAGKSSIG